MIIRTIRGIGFAGFLALAAGTVACGGNVCEDAAEICGTSGGDGNGAECTGAAEATAQCIVDADSCTAEALADCAN